METLGILFGSDARVKIMRLFLFNATEAYDVALVAAKSKVSTAMARKELHVLEKAKLIRKKSFTKITEHKKRGKVVVSKKRASGWELDARFFHLAALQNLLTTSKALAADEMLKKLGKAGKLKLVLVAGVFTQDPNSRVDLLVVGNQMSTPVLNSIIRTIESELGRELAYACFETADFQYRMNMYDKLVRDIMDYPHRILLDRLFA